MKNLFNQTYRKDLQGLRAIAIFLVVFAHLNIPYFKGGFIGVDIFFVLSGYLITGLLIKEYDSSNTIDFTRFYARRLKRLLPSLIFMIGIVLIVTSFMMSPYEMISKTKSVIYASTWTSNFYFTFSEVGYFSEIELRDIFLHTWSLSVEEQYYLIWPLFIFTIFIIFKKNFKSFDINTVFLSFLISTFFLSYSLSLYWSYEKSLWAFYLMPTRIWQFTLGGIVLVLLRKKTNLLSIAAPIQFLGLTLIFFSAIFLHPHITYPGWWALIPSFGTAFVLLPNQRFSKSILTSPILVWIGDRSYAWYLWHWPIIIVAESYGLGSQINESILLGSISLLVASISYKLIEIPIWKGSFSKSKPKKSIRLSVLAMSLIVATSIKVSQHQENILDTENSNNTISTASTPSIYSLGCDSWYSSSTLKPCIFNDENYNKTVVLIGDSILAQWFSAFEGIYSGSEWRLIVFTKSACPMIDEDYFYERIGKNFDICSIWKNNLINELETLNPEMIILGSSSYYPFTDEQWLKGSKRIFSKLSRSTNEILVIPGTPILTYDGPSCLMRSLEDNNNDLLNKNDCPAVKVSPHIEKITNILVNASSDYKNIGILNLNNLVCPNGECRVVTDNGIPIFRDNQHLTDNFVRHLAPKLKSKINAQSINRVY